MQRRGTTIALLLGAALLVIAVVVRFAIAPQRDRETLVDIGFIPLATPRSMQGFTPAVVAPVPAQWHRGQWTYIYAGYTHCPDMCPITLAAMNTAHYLRAATASTVAADFLMFTIDPARDTATRMRDYLRSFDGRIGGLRSTPERLALHSRLLGVGSAAVADTGLIDHGGQVALVDPQQRLVGHFRRGTSADALVKTVDILAHSCVLDGVGGCLRADVL